MKQFTNIISEHYLLGSILWDAGDNILRLRGDGITHKHFTTSFNKRIWNQAGQFYDNDQIHSIDVMEAQPEILGLPDGREMAAHIGDLRRDFSGVAHLAQHIITARQFKAVRSTYEASQLAIGMIESGECAEDVISSLEASMSEARESLLSKKPWKNTKEIVKEIVEIVGKAQQDIGFSGESSGVDLIDEQTGGLEPGQLWVVAAPSTCGKTMLMVQFMQSFITNGKHVLVFSFETQAGKIGIRSISNAMNIDGKEMLGRAGMRMSPHNMGRFKAGLEKLTAGDNLAICDNFDLTLESMLAITAMRLKIGHPVDLIIVDYIQLVSISDTKGKNREQQIAEVSRGLKKLAKMAHCPVVTASQLNEQGKTRESRAIVQDADILLTIDPDGECIHLAKNRDGERGEKLKLRMNGKYQRFEQHNDDLKQ